MSFYDNINQIKYADNHSTYDNSQISYTAWRKWGDLAPMMFPEYHKIEILAPVNKNSYKTAIYNGANAVYFGYKEFNARANGDNFETISEIVDFCHLNRVKAYLALNICFKSTELKKVEEIIIEAENAKIDAFIIADLSILPIIKKFSKAQVNASTQMGVHNYLGANYLSNLGFDRVILSREATIEDIKAIKDANIPISLEVFCHGALCVAFSGACLLSSMLTGNSGNRGQCLQLCRNFFKSELNGKEMNEGYLLSAKDICLVDDMHEFFDMKIDSLKIEGRLRRNEYVAATTEIYTKLKTGDPCEDADKEVLKKMFNRGNFTRGYLDKDNIIYPYIPSHIGAKCGNIVKILSKKLVLARFDYEINKNDGFKIIRNRREVCGATATGEIQNGNYVLFVNENSPVNINDDVFITTDTNLNQRLMKVVEKINIEVAICMLANKSIKIKAYSNNAHLEFEQEVLPRSNGLVITKQDVLNQFAKTKDSDFNINVIYANIGSVYMSKAGLNALRREIIDKMTQKLLQTYNRSQAKKISLPKQNSYKILGDFVEVVSINQVTELLQQKITNIVYAPTNITLEDCDLFYKSVKSNQNLVFFKPPIFIPSNKVEFIEKVANIFDAIIANNLGMIELAKKLGKHVVAGYNLNITNNKNLLIKDTNQYIASVELHKSELSSMKHCLIYTYGNLPLMYLNHCPRKLNGENCNNCGCKLIYRDAKGQYPITTIKLDGYCQHVLKNGIITNLGKTIDNHYRYFDFSDTNVKEIDKILYNYYNKDMFDTTNYNKLHLNRGVK